MEQAFSNIYANKVWVGGSGSGSRAAATVPYRSTLQAILDDPSIKTVFDVGCGDWQFSHLLNWAGKQYVGCDVVPSLVDQLNRTYGRDGIEFRCIDISAAPSIDMLRSDLILCKDVLQHWPTVSVQTFLTELAICRLALITNTVAYPSYAERQNANWDIPVGGFRPLNLLQPPFNLKATEVLRYEIGVTGDVKSCLLYRGCATRYQF